jgi:serine/threonine protein kinase
LRGLADLGLKMLDGTTDEKVRRMVKGGLIDLRMVEKVTEYGEVMEEMPVLIELIKGERKLADLALKMLEPDPFLRIGIDDILRHEFVSDWEMMEN